jgi:hypothetical protein
MQGFVQFCTVTRPRSPVVFKQISSLFARRSVAASTRSTPRSLSGAELSKVAGGSPKGTWRTAETVATTTPMSPKGTW